MPPKAPKDFFQGGEEFVGSFVEFEGRFFEKAGGAVLLEAGGVFLGHAGHDDDGDGVGSGIDFEGLEDIGAAHFGQEHIEENEVGEFFAGDEEGLLAVDGARHVVSSAGESAFGGQPEKLAVFDEKNFCHRAVAVLKLASGDDGNEERAPANLIIGRILKSGSGVRLHESFLSCDVLLGGSGTVFTVLSRTVGARNVQNED